MQELYQESINLHIQIEKDVENEFYKFQEELQRKEINQEKKEKYIMFLGKIHDIINKQQKKVDAIELREIKKKGIQKSKFKGSQ